MLMLRRHVLPELSFLKTRGLHTSSVALSHIGKQIIPIPPSVKLDYPALTIPPTSSITSDIGRRILKVSGPLGTRQILLLPPVVLRPHSSDTPNLEVQVHDTGIKQQRAVWGFSRTMINNAVVGVSEGYKLGIRLVGVGYRASVEPIPKVFLDQMKRAPPKTRTRAPGAPPAVERGLPTERLNLKLGFSHPVLIDIPTDIQVTLNSPTNITLAGIDKEHLGLFAASIRRKRKPEPYRGKGVFVGDETIKLKEVKKK